MSLAQDKTIPIRVVRIGGIDAQGAPIKAGDQVCHGEAAPQVRGLGAMDHANCVRAQDSSGTAQELDRCFTGHGLQRPSPYSIESSGADLLRQMQRLARDAY